MLAVLGISLLTALPVLLINAVPLALHKLRRNSYPCNCYVASRGPLQVYFVEQPAGNFQQFFVGVDGPSALSWGLMNDAVTAREAIAAGIGASMAFDIGAAVPPQDGMSPPAVSASCTVFSAHPVAVTLTGPMMMRGARSDLGPSALRDYVSILMYMTSAAIQLIDQALLAMLGIDAASIKIVALKSAVRFRADFGRIASHVVVAKMAG